MLMTSINGCNGLDEDNCDDQNDQDVGDYTHSDDQDEDDCADHWPNDHRACMQYIAVPVSLLE